MLEDVLITEKYITAIDPAIPVRSALFFQTTSRASGTPSAHSTIANRTRNSASKRSRDRARSHSQLVNLVPLIQLVTATLRESAARKQIQLLEILPDVTQETVPADGSRIQQIVTILLENAIKFTPVGGQVTLRLECYGAEIHIVVSDTGIGIAPDFLPYVFDRFTQAEVPSRHSPGGVGIGLAIVRHLVELHHGTIKAASVGEGQGATFTVRLPLINSADALLLER